ncbi:OLC1v1029472C1 [Oldenlandia corymbosa var. corymbosa]|uniref:OLC1v1029472C1 n=1 Tax=Oldenlandia corymbosa var. corymbosa TaxID=529605 RepID=A0AAV1CH12_OLDCO|nr:OLC1v1029472C1 [Oldenlandia corymbosa var. corymbosa]
MAAWASKATVFYLHAFYFDFFFFFGFLGGAEISQQIFLQYLLKKRKKPLDSFHSCFPIGCLILTEEKMISIENHDHDELFQFLGVLPQQQNMALQSGLLTLQMPKTEPTQLKTSRKRKSCQDQESPEEYLKKIIHRDVERQRRKEMATLHSSLRSLVPYEFVQKRSLSVTRKEKRSISDDMHGAVNYIKHLRGKVDELMKKRDELQKLMKCGCGSNCSSNGSCFSVNYEKTSVTVQSSITGMQVIIRTGLLKGLLLSKVFRVLNGEGMAVVSCTSTRATDGQIHAIECEIDAGKSPDQINLQKRLEDLVSEL